MRLLLLTLALLLAWGASGASAEPLSWTVMSQALAQTGTQPSLAVGPTGLVWITPNTARMWGWSQLKSLDVRSGRLTTEKPALSINLPLSDYPPETTAELERILTGALAGQRPAGWQCFSPRQVPPSLLVPGQALQRLPDYPCVALLPEGLVVCAEGVLRSFRWEAAGLAIGGGTPKGNGFVLHATPPQGVPGIHLSTLPNEGAQLHPDAFQECRELIIKACSLKLVRSSRKHGNLQELYQRDGETPATLPAQDRLFRSEVLRP